MKNKILYIYIILFLLILIAFNSSTAFAQFSRKPQQEESKPLKLTDVSEDEGFQLTEVPEKWKNESAVVLCHDKYFVYNRKKQDGVFMPNPDIQNFRESIHSRKRIKLQDESAIENFPAYFYSDLYNLSFYINKVEARKRYGGTPRIKFDFDVLFHIIKPDGRVIEVNSSQVFEAGKKISIHQLDEQRLTSKKLNLPELEVGDIVDYAYMQTVTELWYSFYVFEKKYVSIADAYPKVKQNLNIVINDKDYLNLKSLNDAPKLQLMALTEEQKKDKELRSLIQYRMTDKMRGKIEEKPSLFKERFLPTVKFHIYTIYKNLKTNTTYAFLGEKGIAKENTTAQELTEYINSEIESSRDKSAKRILNYIREYHPMENNKRKLVDLAYYTYRHLEMRKKDIYYYNQSKTPDFKPYDNKFIYWGVSSYSFTKTLSKVFKTLQIEHSIYASVLRTTKSREDLLFPKELGIFMKVKVEGEEFILTNFYRDTNMGDTPYDLEGAKIIYQYPNMIESSIRLPISTFEDNNSSIQTSIEFGEDMDALEITRNTTHIGQNKTAYSIYAVVNSDFRQAEEDKYQNIYNTEGIPDIIAERRSKEKPRRLIQMKSIAAKELQTKIAKYKKFKLLQDGRYHTEPELKYQEEFIVKSLLQELSDTYEIEIGKFIGIQEEITKEMRAQRQHDIYLPYAQSFDHKITLNIPESHAIESIASLNTEVDNETGSFISTAKMEGNQLQIETRKAYKDNFEPKENWSKMLEVLEAAYQFSQQKVVLKKK